MVGWAVYADVIGGVESWSENTISAAPVSESAGDTNQTEIELQLLLNSP
jgi:hypothetical protein